MIKITKLIELINQINSNDYKLNSLTHVLEIYKFYNELVELIIGYDVSHFWFRVLTRIVVKDRRTNKLPD